MLCLFSLYDHFSLHHIVESCCEKSQLFKLIDIVSCRFIKIFTVNIANMYTVIFVGKNQFFLQNIAV